MTSKRTLGRLAACAAPLLATGLVIAGCGSGSGGAMSMDSSGHMAGMAGMKGMKMGSSSKVNAIKPAKSANGIKPVPTQVLGSATWQGMKITAKAMTPVPFVVFDGKRERKIKPGKASFHLMVYLNDAHSGAVIPYATVWATIKKGSKVISDERQWPMISRFMGPHYGNDVTVPGSGTYSLSLLISPPVSARHVEYAHVWLKPHRVNMTFHWKQRS